MYFTDAKDAFYKAGVPRDQRAYFATLDGTVCPKCGAEAGFSTLNEVSDWSDNTNPFRCAVCNHMWDEA